MARERGPHGDEIAPQPPTDTVSSLSWSPVANILVASSWSSECRSWEVKADGLIVPLQLTKHAGPVLTTAFNPDGQRVYTGGADKTIRCWDLPTNKSAQIGFHDGVVKNVNWVSEANVVVSGGWDQTLRYWDPRASVDKTVVSVPLTDKVFCMDVSFPVGVVGCGGKSISIFDIRNPMKPVKAFQSPLKMQSRYIALSPDKSWFALAGIEGRVAIHHVEEKDSSGNFAYKCHRDMGHTPVNVYAVNGISFHPEWCTFATVGGDGSFAFWDKDSKQRLKQFEKAPTQLSAGQFNANGYLFAYAVGYDWSQGIQGRDKHKNVSILVHTVVEGEIRARGKSSAKLNRASRGFAASSY